jgi:hypothetical protein
LEENVSKERFQLREVIKRISPSIIESSVKIKGADQIPKRKFQSPLATHTETTLGRERLSAQLLSFFGAAQVDPLKALRYE